MVYIVDFNYFDSKGNQKNKRIERKSEKAILIALSKYDIYSINAVSRNLQDNETINGLGW